MKDLERKDTYLKKKKMKRKEKKRRKEVGQVTLSSKINSITFGEIWIKV